MAILFFSNGQLDLLQLHQSYSINGHNLFKLVKLIANTVFQYIKGNINSSCSHTSNISASRPWSSAILTAAAARAPGVSTLGGELTRSLQRLTPEATAAAPSSPSDP